MEHCKFNNCVHYNEKECAIREAVETDMSGRRYLSYLSIYEELQAKTLVDAGSDTTGQ